MNPMTAAERVKSEITAIGVMSEFGWGTSLVPKFMTMTRTMIYAAAVRALTIGFFVIYDNYSIIRKFV